MEKLLIAFNKILSLNKHHYREERIDTVLPTYKTNLVGTHHFHASSNWGVVDYSRKTRLRSKIYK